MIKSLDYAYIINDKDLKHVGLNRGQLVLVTGLKPAPIKKDDPYLQRIFAHIIPVDKDGLHHIPKEDNDNMIYLVDPRSLEKVNEKTQEELEEALRHQYGQED